MFSRLQTLMAWIPSHPSLSLRCNSLKLETSQKVYRYSARSCSSSCTATSLRQRGLSRAGNCNRGHPATKRVRHLLRAQLRHLGTHVVLSIPTNCVDNNFLSSRQLQPQKNLKIDSRDARGAPPAAAPPPQCTTKFLISTAKHTLPQHWILGIPNSQESIASNSNCCPAISTWKTKKLTLLCNRNTQAHSAWSLHHLRHQQQPRRQQHHLTLGGQHAPELPAHKHDLVAHVAEAAGGHQRTGLWQPAMQSSKQICNLFKLFV